MAFWDVNYSPDDLYAILTKEKEQVNYMTIERLYVRLLETYSWYKLLELVPKAQWIDLLDESVIQKLRFEQLKARYRNVAKLLRRSALSFAR